MPNHIQNKLQVIGDNQEVQKVLKHIKGKHDDGVEIEIDFNKIRPMPKGMDSEVNSHIKMWVEVCTGQLDFATLFQPMEDSVSNLLKDNKFATLSKRMAANTALEYLTGKRQGTVKDFSDEDFAAFIQCLKNYREHGSVSWYEWNIANWGTKWNAYGQNDKRNNTDTIYFKTAWSSPIKLIQELSRMFPLVKLDLTYADEDSGSNAGKIVLEKGEAIEVNQPKGQSKDAYDIYFELHPGSIDDYKLIGNRYEYIETED
ncbi:MAG: hypothetical protein M3Q58_01315 [Bacteroidota bacterium]|nr:hypothetical protein [Bacteroidota bacterium]